MEMLYVALGGAIGSIARYMLANVIGKQGDFPLPIMLVNVTGSFLMGLWIGYMALSGEEHAKELHLLIAVGILGGYTTFSTFSLESFLLLEKGLYTQAALYVSGSVILSIAALFAGLFIFRTISA